MNNGMWDSSEYSSGCESGWTVYLEQSFLSPYPPSNTSHGKFVQGKQVELVADDDDEDEDEDEDQDMSMVSDASSGPPHFQHFQQHHDIINNGCYYKQDPVIDYKRNNGKRKKNKDDLHLDDTASSPVFDFSQNNSTMIHNQAMENHHHHHHNNNNSLDFSKGYSATHFQGRSSSSSSSSHTEQLASYFQYLPNGNQMQQNQWHGGSMMGMRR